MYVEEDEEENCTSEEVRDEVTEKMVGIND